MKGILKISKIIRRKVMDFDRKTEYYNIVFSSAIRMEGRNVKKLMNRIDRFCYSHPRFGIPRLMLYIIIGNLALWLVMQMDTTGKIFQFFCFNPTAILRGQIWRLFTWVLIPTSGSGVLWFVLEMYFYFWVGQALEQAWGAGKFTIFYCSGILLTAVFGLILSLIYGGNEVFSQMSSFIVTARYLNFSLFFAFATLYAESQLLLFFLLPIKAKWLGVVDAVFFVYEIIRIPFPLNLLPVVAVLNYLLFCGDWLFDFFRPARIQQRKKTVDFKREAARIRREQAEKPYRHKCEVCGKTDTDYPDLEFRYCSRCQGYHCFCQEHISNHIHFTE